MLVVSKSPEWRGKKKETLTRIIFLKFYFIKIVNIIIWSNGTFLLLTVNCLANFI